MEETSVLKETGYSTALYGMKGQVGGWYWSLILLVLKAFGVGALEEEDEDIYEQQSLATYHAMDVDEGDTRQEITYGWTGQLDTGMLPVLLDVCHLS